MQTPFCSLHENVKKSLFVLFIRAEISTQTIISVYTHKSSVNLNILVTI